MEFKETVTIVIYRSRKSVTQAWITAILVMTMTLCVGCTREGENPDPRAYPDSAGEVSLQTLLSGLHFTPRACMLEQVRYFVGYYPDDIAYIKFVTSDECAENFLAETFPDPLKTHLHYDGKDSKFFVFGDPDTLKILGWPVDKVVEYDDYDCQDARVGRGMCNISVIPGTVTQLFITASYSVRK